MNERKPSAKPSIRPAGKPRRNRSGKRTPFRPALHSPAEPGNQATSSPSQVADMMRMGNESKTGQFAEQLQAGNKDIKRERLHKVLAQSGHGSRRDMEILIASGRVMVNGVVAGAGVQVGPGDAVLVDHRHVKLTFGGEFPRVLLYHKPEGEIVTTSDPGNRITVFDNLPKVQNGKWLAIGRLDFNTSGLLIFTTNGELANRMTHPRFEVEREYAVRILGSLTEEQNQRLLEGIDIDAVMGSGNEYENEDEENEPDFEPILDHELDQDHDGHDHEHGPGHATGVAEAEENKANAPARFLSIEPRGGEGANHWYHVIIKEGRNREVRRMFEALGLTVSRLMRVRFGKIELPPRLLRGKMQELDPQQVKDLLVWAGVPTEGMDLPRQKQHGAQRGREQEREVQRKQGPPAGHGKQGKTQGKKVNRTGHRGNQARQGGSPSQPGNPSHHGNQAHLGNHAHQGDQAATPPRAGAENKPAAEEGNRQNQRRHRSRRTRPPRSQEPT